MLRIFLIFLLCCHLGCAFKKKPVQEKKNVIESLVVSHPGRNGPLTPLEMKMAKVAWRYFENNYQPIQVSLIQLTVTLLRQCGIRPAI